MCSKDGEKGISPVIGVIIMVAITVILAAVIAAFVFGMSENISRTSENYEYRNITVIDRIDVPCLFFCESPMSCTIFASDYKTYHIIGSDTCIKLQKGKNYHVEFLNGEINEDHFVVIP